MNFYLMQEDDKYKRLKYSDDTEWYTVKCPKNDCTSERTRIGDLRGLVKQKKHADLMPTVLADWMITDQVRSVFLGNEFTGFRCEPAFVINQEFPYSFWELIITGSGGAAHPSSGIFLKEKCAYCKWERYSAYENGIIIDENNWDGSDFFTVKGYPLHILVTERVKRIMEEQHLTGVQFIPSQELVWPKWVIKP